MLQDLFQAIWRTGIFMICAQAIVHFRPQESYEKYLKLLVSTMILVQLFLPVGSFFLPGGRKETTRQLEAFMENMEEELRFSEEQAAETDRILERMTLEEVRKRMEEQDSEQTGENTEEIAGDNPEEYAGKETNDEKAGSDTVLDMGKITVELEPVEPVTIR